MRKAARKPDSPARRRAGGGMLIGIFIGLVLGVAIAFAVAWYVSKTPIPFASRSTNGAVPKPAEPATSPGAPAQEPKSAPGEAKPGDKPRFDFYNILPGDKPAVPAAPVREAQPGAGESLYLQAGAFKEPNDADNLKAKLALIGFEATVQPVEVAGKGALHRVRIGPFATPEDMGRARKALAENGIEATLVKNR